MDFRHLSFDNAPSITTTPPGPRSKEYLAFQASHEASAVSYPKGLPLALQRGRGATVEDVDGNVYIDFFGGAGVMAVGHANPEVIAAAEQQLRELTHALDFPTPARRSLVEALLSVLPSALTRVFFGGPTGSDAVESAVKLARLNTGRVPLVAFEAVLLQQGDATAGPSGLEPFAVPSRGLTPTATSPFPFGDAV